MVGGMVLLAAGGTAAAIKLTQQDAARIMQHAGDPPRNSPTKNSRVLCRTWASRASL